MLTLWRLVRGGLLRTHRAETLGIAAGLTGLIDAVAQWAVGDLSLISLLRALGDNWALIAGGLGLVTLAAKVERNTSSGESVSDIAGRALRP